MNQPKERPILLTAPMVRAILDGRKTQTRRIVKLPPDERLDILAGKVTYFSDEGKFLRCPYGHSGDQLWVKETWKPDPSWGQSSSPTMEIQEGSNILYRSTLQEAYAKHGLGKWRPSIFMRRWMSRIILEVTAVRVERLQTITEEDAIAEGIYFDHAFDGYVTDDEGRHYHGNSAARSYEHLWDSINDKNPPRGEIRQGIHPHSWDANPWVWVIEFKRLQPSTLN